MSFAIAAVYKNKELFLATDRRIGASDPAEIQEDADKIVRVSPTTAIALTGIVGLAATIAEVFKAQYNARWNFQRCVDELVRIMPACYQVYVDKYGVEGDVVLLLGNSAGAAPKAAAIRMNRGKVSVSTTSICAGQYLYQIAAPQDMSFESCRRVCSEHFENNSLTDPTQCLRDLVGQIATYSKVANGSPNVWKGVRPAGGPARSGFHRM